MSEIGNEIQQVSDSETTQQEQQPQEAKKYRLKIDEREEDLSESELTELVKAGRSANHTNKEALELRSLLEHLKLNPKKALTDPKFGIDLYKLAEETLLERIQEDMLSPEQKKLKDYERRFKEIEEKEKSEKEKKEQEQLAQAESHWMNHYDKMFHEALSSAGLPKTQRTIKRMAEVAAFSLEKGQDIDAKGLASILRDDYISELKELLSSSDEDSVLQLLGEEIGNKIRKADLKRLKSTQSMSSVSVSRNGSKTTPSPSKKISSDEWREHLERIKQGLE